MSYFWYKPNHSVIFIRLNYFQGTLLAPFYNDNDVSNRITNEPINRLVNIVQISLNHLPISMIVNCHLIWSNCKYNIIILVPHHRHHPQQHNTYWVAPRVQYETCVRFNDPFNQLNHTGGLHKLLRIRIGRQPSANRWVLLASQTAESSS